MIEKEGRLRGVEGSRITKRISCIIFFFFFFHNIFVPLMRSLYRYMRRRLSRVRFDALKILCTA